jgi:hypothetical protein
MELITGSLFNVLSGIITSASSAMLGIVVYFWHRHSSDNACRYWSQSFQQFLLRLGRAHLRPASVLPVMKKINLAQHQTLDARGNSSSRHPRNVPHLLCFKYKLSQSLKIYSNVSG